ncbi:arylsulfatase B-like [Sycon ciliatum]|uniref:arylsulfatase B-like n=1 Tax=Sycon ciliatum TaxID=27933 RepID=UPI0020ACC163|eukprot:scpid946/ scgid28817/ Arylsulfatase B; N-acetylgalactosamine-4-sulfatase
MRRTGLVRRSLIEMIRSWCVFTLVAACIGYGQFSEAAKQPHVLLVVADDLGWGDVGFHGSEIRTPVLDKLATDGVTLDNYYVQPVCSPTRTSILTGRYPIRYGLLHHVYPNNQLFALPTNETLLPEKLNQAGYTSHMVGKWHLGFYSWQHVPTARGFETFFGFYGGAEDYFEHTASGGIDYRNDTRPVPKDSTYSAFTFAREAQRVVRQYANSQSSKPLFLYLAFQNVHSPQEVPDSYYVKPYAHIENKNRRKFAGMVSCMDEAIGNVTDLFKELGLWDDTLMVFTADNGGPVNVTFSGIGAVNWPLRGSKHTLWDGGVRGTAFVHGAGVDVSNKNTSAMMHATDLFPTIIAAAGGNTEGTLPLDGHDLWPILSTGSGESPRTEILHNYDPLATGGDKGCCGYAGLRSGEWKLLIGPGAPDGWYPEPSWEGDRSLLHDATSAPLVSDLPDILDILGPDAANHTVYLFKPREDPEERNNLATSETAIVTQLTAHLQMQYIAHAVPDGHTASQPAANPKNFNGYWTPWVNKTDACN